MTTYTLSDLRRAFLAAYNEAYSQGAKKWAYREQEAWDDYAKVLQVEEPITDGDAGKYPQCGKHPAQLPENLAAYAEESPWMHQDWQREHDRLLLEEVDKRLNDCRNRIAGAFLEVSEIDYGIGVKTMFGKMADILGGDTKNSRVPGLVRAKDIAFELTQKFGELDYGDFACALEEEIRGSE